MSRLVNGNGNGGGSGTSVLTHKPIPQKSASAGASKTQEVKESRVSFRSTENIEIIGNLSRITRHSAYFELYGPGVPLRLSECFDDFRIIIQKNPVYIGRAVVRNLVDDGSKFICEVTLDESAWKNPGSNNLLTSAGELQQQFVVFIEEWQKLFKVSSVFKVVVADMQSILHDLKLWLDRLELQLETLPKEVQKDASRKVMEEVGRLFVPAFDALHERLEAISADISEDLRPAHRAYIQRQLHPLMLCSPFAHRAQSKPLGYAGDYQMVNMIAMDPYQGETLFARIVNLWFLSQWPSKAHRNRLNYLKSQLEGETLRLRAQNRKVRIFNFACGPAYEVQQYFAEFEPSRNAELTLADFNQETLDHVAEKIRNIKERTGREASVAFQRKNIVQALKENLKKTNPRPEFDFVYSAGIFDYLPDSTCTQLLEVFYDWLAPGGLLVATNVVDDKPFRHMLEFVLDWHLICRDTNQSKSLFPASIPLDERSLKKDPTGVNIFIEARKSRE